jgi:hypothetical protein
MAGKVAESILGAVMPEEATQRHEMPREEMDEEAMGSASMQLGDTQEEDRRLHGVAKGVTAKEDTE